MNLFFHFDRLIKTNIFSIHRLKVWPIKINNSFLRGRAQKKKKNLKCIIKYAIKIRVLHGKNYFFNYFSTLKHIIIYACYA